MIIFMPPSETGIQTGTTKEKNMAKDQFKTKVKIESLAPRFGILPLVDKGDEIGRAHV